MLKLILIRIFIAHIFIATFIGCSVKIPYTNPHLEQSSPNYGKIKETRQYTYRAEQINGEITKGKRDDKISGQSDYYWLIGRDGTKTFDKKGNLTSQIFNYSNDSLQYYRTCVYNKIGEPKEMSKYDKHDSLVSRTVYDYTNRGRKCELLFYGSNGLLKSRSLMHYEPKMKQLSFMKLSDKDLAKTYAIFTYDSNLNQISSNQLDSDGNLSSKTIYLYNNFNLCDTSLYGSSNNFRTGTERLTTYKYDSNNHKTEEKKFDIYGRISKTINFSYKYDEKKNWIYKIMYVNSIPTIIVEREIIYY